MSEIFKRLRASARQFRRDVFPQYKALFEALATGQSPTVLLITCSDSRLSPELVTRSAPGEIFVERNPGSLVPVYAEETMSVSASIEYAVKVLGIKYIVVCGHSDCGAMKAALHPEKAAALPAVARWLSLARPASRLLSARERNAKPDRELEAFTKHCIRLQLKHLVSHPSVAEAVRSQRLTVRGAYYDIKTGRISRVTAMKPK